MPSMLTETQTAGGEFEISGRFLIWVRAESGTWGTSETVTLQIKEPWGDTWVNFPTVEVWDGTTDAMKSVRIPEGASVRLNASAVGYQGWFYAHEDEVLYR